MRADRSASGAAPTDIDWAVAAVRDAVHGHRRIAVVGPDASVAVALTAVGHDVAVVGTDDAVPSDVDAVVLADALAWVADDERYLGALRADHEEATLVVAASNVTWAPFRADLLAGRVPHGEVAVADRPLRFHARAALARSLATTGWRARMVHPARRPVSADELSVDGLLAELVVGGPDADVVGFVITATADEPVDLAAASVGSDEHSSPSPAPSEAPAPAPDEVEVLRAENERLRHEYEAVTGRAAYRLLTRVEAAMRRVPGGGRVARSVGAGLRRLQR